MRFQLSITMIVFILCAITTQSTLKHEGVSWNKKRNLWQAEFYFNGKKQKSYFDNEFDASKKLNQLCVKMEIPPQNPEIYEIRNEQKREKISQYKGVTWHKTSRKWHVQLQIKGEKQKYGGRFDDELDAAKRVNQLCEEWGIPHTITDEQFQKKEKISLYKGVTWHKQSGKWYAQLKLKGEKTKYGGIFKDELDAAKRVNQLCEKLEIPPYNPTISAIPNHQYQKRGKISQYKGVTWDKQSEKWHVRLQVKGTKQKFGGRFNDELDAAKRVNQLCEELGIPHAITDEQFQKKEKISLYKGVTWHKKSGKWAVQLALKGERTKYGGTYKDELDAAKRVNQLCEELKIPPFHPTISAIPNHYQKAQKISQYKGVTWHKQSGKWYVQLRAQGKKQKYGGMFNDELDAAKRVNQLCEKFGIPQQNPTISAIPEQNYQEREKTSQYKGVYWHKQHRKWYARLLAKGEKYGGVFKNELDAAKRVNQLCEEFGIPQRNPTINAIPYEQNQKKEKTSQYKGVYWHKQSRKWCVRLSPKGATAHFGGCFKDELDAGKRVNQICEKLRIPLQNPEISAMPNQQHQKREKTSQYKGVHWNKQIKKWCAQLILKGEKQKFGGSFNDELDAAKKVNQLCEEFSIPQQNPTITAVCNFEETILDYNAMQAEFEGLIKILDENYDPTTSSINENLKVVINNGGKEIMPEINLRTNNGESALSIAAKHGFSNAVKFFISKGADKEHFTNEHHTPLSLAVRQNHLKVVQVLLEDWISPNSHEKPYLHLAPIFNVKSREIAQLLIDNDAVTHQIYNDKNQSPLTIACQNGYLDVVEFFLDDGLDINHLDSDNKTPLFYALLNKHHEIANLLISKGAQNVVQLKSYGTKQ